MRLIKKLIVSIVLTGLVFTTYGQKEPFGPFAPGEALVRFKSTAAQMTINQVHMAVGAHVLKSFEIVPNLQLVRFPAGLGLSDVLALYRQNPEVLYAEPNFIVRQAQSEALTPNDPLYGQLWNLHNTGQTGGTPDADIDAPEAWGLSTGSSDVVVAVVDTGVDYNHTDLRENMWQNTADCNTNGLDDDGNGFIDDCYGIDVINNDSDPMDDDDHGTHMAGIIGARGNNGVGVVGINWQVKIMACKFLGADGSGTVAGAIACLQYVKLMKNRGVNIVATNNSWGGGGFSQALFDAIREHQNMGILFVAAAGNFSANNDTAPFFPANYYLPNVITAASTTHTDALSVFSNFGQRTVHLGAPGENIRSTVRNNGYRAFSGTSMAAPHVTGLTALLKAQNPGRDWIALRNLILASGDVKSSLQSKTITGSRLNAHQALACSNTPFFALLRPFPLVGGGTPITIAAVNINCAAPAGPLTVTVTPGGTVVNLQDNGTGPDLAANDGIYSGLWTPGDICQIGTFTLNFSNGQSATVQVGGAKGSYSCTTPPISWRTISGTNLNLDDDQSVLVNPGFSVRFGAGSYNSLHIGSNGIVSFTEPVDDFDNTPLPNSTYITLIVPFWDDLYPKLNTDNNVFWAVLGTAPNRELVIEWRNVGLWACHNDPTATVRFQVVFFEGSSDILFNYQDVLFGGACSARDRGGSATVGVQMSASDATQIGFNSQILSDGLAVHWSGAPSSGTADLVIQMTDHPDPVTVGSNLTYTITVANSGPDAASGVTLINTLPASVNFVSATPATCTRAGSTVTCALGTLAPSNTATVTITAMPTLAGTISNTANVSATESDPDMSDNSATENTTVKPSNCAGVTVSTPAASITYTPTTTRPSRKTIRVVFRNDSGSSQVISNIAPVPGAPFTIVSTNPALPRVIPNKRSYSLRVVTERAAGLEPATAIPPFFNISMSCGLLTTSFLSHASVDLHLKSIKLQIRIDRLHIEVIGTSAKSLRLQLFDLSGRLLTEQTAQGHVLRMKALDNMGRPIANGVYLYVVTVVTEDGRSFKTEVRKLLLQR